MGSRLAEWGQRQCRIRVPYGAGGAHLGRRDCGDAGFVLGSEGCTDSHSFPEKLCEVCVFSLSIWNSLFFIQLGSPGSVAGLASP